MSTKIYEAWRWKKALGMSPILRQVETIMKKQMHQKAQEFLKEVEKDVEPGGDSVWGVMQVMKICAQLTQFSRISPYRAPRGDFTCDFCVWDWKQHFYMYPIGKADNWDFKDVYKIPGLEDFRYWNNTDEPEGMSRREWNRRGRIWNAQHDWENPIVKTVYSVLDPISPVGELSTLFDPRWASEAEMKRYGLPTCRTRTQAAAQKRDKDAKRRIRCKFCKNLVPKTDAHRHQKKWVCDSCWDERLRVAE
jgi:hypothetical protein